MKLGQTKPGRKLPPPRITEQENTTMTTETTETTATEKTVAPKLPINFKFASELDRVVDRLSARKSGSYRKLRQRLDDWFESEQDEAVKAQLGEIRESFEEALDLLATASKGLKELPENFAKRAPKTAKPALEEGTTCKVVEKHTSKYDGILPSLEGLTVTGFRKTHVMVVYGEGDEVERFVIPKAHLEAMTN